MKWETFQKEVEKLAKKVDSEPDIIVGITRGGMMPARLLSSLLNIKNMRCITVRKTGSSRKVITELRENLNSKNVLLVEDMLETGKSMVAAKKYLERQGARVKTICLYIMPVSEIKPDFYLEEVTNVKKFPWE